MKSIVESGYVHGVIFLAFDGGPCFDGLHSRMFADLCGQVDLCDPGLLNLLLSTW
jgi:hypothetical protein